MSDLQKVFLIDHLPIGVSPELAAANLGVVLKLESEGGQIGQEIGLEEARVPTTFRSRDASLELGFQQSELYAYGTQVRFDESRVAEEVRDFLKQTLSERYGTPMEEAESDPEYVGSYWCANDSLGVVLGVTYNSDHVLLAWGYQRHPGYPKWPCS